MANQYTQNFDHVSKEKFGKSAKDLLLQYAKEGLTYANTAKITGVMTGTIRKWCNRYNIRLLPNGKNLKGKAVKDFSLLATKSVFRANTINKENALSRQWLGLNHSKANC